MAILGVWSRPWPPWHAVTRYSLPQGLSCGGRRRLRAMPAHLSDPACRE